MKKHIRIITIMLTLFMLLSCEKDSVKTESLKKDIYFDAGINKITSEQQAPDFTLNNIEGESISLSDFKGQVVLLNFWASWCGPCISEMPSLETLQDKTKDLNFKILAVNIGESSETAADFINNNGYTFETLSDPKNNTATLFGVRSIPTTYLLNKDGNIVAGKLGAYEWDNENLIQIITELINE